MPPATWAYVEVGSFVRVTLWTVGRRGMLCREPRSSQNVLSMAYRFKVGGIDAVADPAEMIEFKARRDGSFGKFPHPAVREEAGPVDGHAPVAVGLDVSGPQPAICVAYILLRGRIPVGHQWQDRPAHRPVLEGYRDSRSSTRFMRSRT